MSMRFSALFLLASMVVLVSWGSLAEAQCHAVTPTGSGTKDGSSWTNAMAGLPTSLAAGNTYYLADGTYSVYHSKSSGAAGSIITVKKGTAADYGQGCGIGAGWNASVMGSSQAVFPNSFWIQGSYFVLDGAISNPDGTGGGIKIPVTASNTSCPGFGNNAGIYVTDFSSGVISNVTIQHVEVAGPGYSVNPDLCATAGIYATGGNSKVTNFTVQNSYIHDVAGNFATWGNGILFQNNVIARDNGLVAGSQHSEAIADTGSSNFTIRWNKFIDIVSTGVIVTVNDSVAATANNWQIYGNVFQWTSTPVSSGVDNGIISCGAGKQCTNWHISNNTISGCNWVVSGYSSKCGIDFAGAGSTSSVTVRNNLWYNSTNVTMPMVSGGTLDNDYDTFLSSSGYPKETHGATGSTNPFVNSAGFDFHLSQDMSTASTAGTQWAQGLALSSPFNIDFDGHSFGTDGTWDRGAFEYGSSGGGVDAPSALQSIVH